MCFVSADATFCPELEPQAQSSAGILSHLTLQDLAAWELLGVYAGELWLDADIDAEQAKVPCGAGLLLFDKQLEAEVVDRSGQGALCLMPCIVAPHERKQQVLC